MTKNVGGIDRVIRIVLGIVFIAVGIVQGGAWYALSVFGAVLLVTAATSFCGLYTLLKVDTKK